MILLDISTGWKTVIMIAAMIAVFYFFLIRPQSQQAKKEQDYRNNLKKGDRVMTSTGIHGVIVSTETGSIQLEVADNVRIKVAKSNIVPIPIPKK